MKIPLLLIGLFFPLFFSSPQSHGQSPDGWNLVWSDEFNDPGRPDPAKWVYETGMVRNGEAQLYTERMENVRVDDGNLIIEARKETIDIPGTDKRAEYTAASIQTKGKADWKYGRFEVRAKIPTGRGMWPAIWMMPNDMTGGWPACGEIDIMENVGFDPEQIHGTVHTKAYNHTIKTQKGKSLKVDKPWEDFHIYAIEWDAEVIHFYVDGTRYYSFANEGTGNATWPFDKSFYIKLNSAVGGGWGGRKGIDDSIFPTKFLIDYVRVYQK
jgi:beta-glucanase (GH16 family)